MIVTKFNIVVLPIVNILQNTTLIITDEMMVVGRERLIKPIRIAIKPTKTDWNPTKKIFGSTEGNSVHVNTSLVIIGTTDSVSIKIM